MALAIGDSAPPFELPSADGSTESLSDGGGSKATVVFWTCNHCPYAIAWHDRLMDVGRDYADRGVRFFAINSNDAERYPADSFDAMRQRVESEDWPMPYLYDESQETARAYGAERTPDVFVFDAEGKLAYRGAPDADYEEPSQNAAWLREALDQVLEGKPVSRAETEPVGCTIKWTE
jgi:peroxiredoxin